MQHLPGLPYNPAMLAYPSPRAAALMLALLALAAAGYLSESLFSVAMACTLVLGMLMLADILLTKAAVFPRSVDQDRQPRLRISVERELPTTLTVAMCRQYSHLLRNNSRIPLRVQIHEDRSSEILREYPARAGAAVTSSPQWTWVRPGEERKVSAQLTPLRRGELALGGVGLRVVGGLGLWIMQFRKELGGSLRVFPLIEELARGDLFAHRRKLYNLGERQSRKFGRGTEFDRLKEYTPDDEYRSINWNATARAGKPVVNQFYVEQARELILMLDCGRLMHTEIAGRSRLDRCLDAAIHLAYMALAHNDRVGLIAFDAELRKHVAAGRTQRHIDKLVEACFDLQPRFVESDYGRAITVLKSRHPKRGMVVLFTDLLDSVSSKSAVANLSRLARTHLPVIVILDDPQVAGLADAEAASLESTYLRASAERFMTEKRRALARLRTRGCLIVNVVAEKLNGSLVSQYLEAKARNVL